MAINCIEKLLPLWQISVQQQNLDFTRSKDNLITEYFAWCLPRPKLTERMVGKTLTLARPIASAEYTG